ncbi:hypothetical protein Q5Z34_15440 [Listeria innocua]
MVDRLVIEVREKQLRFTSLGTNYQLDPWKLVEETFLPEYPNDFPFFRRSPRIHLKEPANEIEILAPKPKETEGRNDLLKTIVPPLGMVVLSGATSFLSGGNPIMMLSMGGASLLTAGFSVSSYLTNKKETNKRGTGNHLPPVYASKKIRTEQAAAKTKRSVSVYESFYR